MKIIIDCPDMSLIGQVDCLYVLHVLHTCASYMCFMCLICPWTHRWPAGPCLGSGPVGDDDLWYHHIPGTLRSVCLSVCLLRPPPPELPAGPPRWHQASQLASKGLQGSLSWLQGPLSWLQGYARKCLFFEDPFNFVPRLFCLLSNVSKYKCLLQKCLFLAEQHLTNDK